MDCPRFIKKICNRAEVEVTITDYVRGEVYRLHSRRFVPLAQARSDKISSRQEIIVYAYIRRAIGELFLNMGAWSSGKDAGLPGPPMSRVQGKG